MPVSEAPKLPSSFFFIQYSPSQTTMELAASTLKLILSSEMSSSCCLAQSRLILNNFSVIERYVNLTSQLVKLLFFLFRISEYHFITWSALFHEFCIVSLLTFLIVFSIIAFATLLNWDSEGFISGASIFPRKVDLWSLISI